MPGWINLKMPHRLWIYLELYPCCVESLNELVTKCDLEEIPNELDFHFSRQVVGKDRPKFRRLEPEAFRSGTDVERLLDRVRGRRRVEKVPGVAETPTTRTRAGFSQSDFFFAR